MVEQRTENPCVGGSIPPRSTFFLLLLLLHPRFTHYLAYKCSLSTLISAPYLQHPLLEFNSNGIYCAQADVYIDPWRKVDRALITHAHADHARYGMKHYLTTPGSALIMRERIGQSLSIETTEYGQKHTIGG